MANMKVLEYHYQGTWYGRIWDAFNNAIAVDPAKLKSFAVAWDNEGIWFPNRTSNFYNGYFFLRLSWPVGVYLQLRWNKKKRFQCGFGWKCNGRLAFTLRYQSDENAAKGVNGPNYGQATGFNRGTA